MSDKKEIKFHYHTRKILLEIFLKVGITMCLYIVSAFVLQFIFTEFIANILYNHVYKLYYLLISFQDVIIFGGGIIVCALTIYLTVRKHISFIDQLVNSIDNVLKKDDTLIVLPKEYREIETKLNTIKYESVKSEQLAREAEQRKNDLVVYLAHDLKTPLTSIIGYLSLLNESVDIPTELREKYLTISLQKSQRLEELINEFFEITRYNLHEMVLENSNINLTLMLKQLVDEYNPIFLDKKLTVNLEIKWSEEIRIYADPNKLARVLENILRNAVNYSFENTEIRIVVEINEETIQIACINHGKVIPAHQLNTIFEKFYRLDSARMTNTGGSGLGLAIAKEIIDRYHGTITVISNEEKTEFNMILPRTMLIKG